MQTDAPKPIADNKRTAIVDILRGWALLGVVIGNYTDYYFFGKPVQQHPGIVSQILMGIHQAFFAAKSWTMLSVLFGYGFAVVMENIATKGKSPIAFFSRRMFWLFVIAFINSAFWFGDILKDYAALGLILLLFYRCTARTAMLTGLGLLFVLPFVVAAVSGFLPYNYQSMVNTYYLPHLYSHNPFDLFAANLKGTFYLEVLSPSYAVNVHMMMFACMLLGFAAQKMNLFNRINLLRKEIKATFWSSIALAIIVSIIMGLMFKFKSPLSNLFKPFYWVIFGTMLMILTGICWLYINNKLKVFFGAMQAMGKMTLTNYITQNIVAWFLYLNIGFGLFNTMPFWFYFAAAVAVFVLQTFISLWWLKHYNYGPVEWLWRQASYGKRLPIRKQQPIN